MRMAIIKRLKFLVFFLVTISGYTQKPIVDSVVASIDRYRKEHYEEKVYLHLDRPSYLTGETMWLKIYLVEASLHTPSTLSTVVYVEILDQDSKPVLQSKVEVKEGKGNGSLFIPATLGTGIYRVRAYTNWMKNSGAEFYFHKEVAIVNPFIADASNKIPLKEKIAIQFFPEGGNLIAGIRSKVAFQIVDTSGKGVYAKGAVIDENADTVAVFSPTHFGIGHFYFTPENNKKYRAILQQEPAQSTNVELPDVLPTGYALEVVEQSQSNQLIIYVRTNLKTSASQTINLFIHSRNRVLKADARKLNNGSVQFQVDKTNLPEGISHITVFDGVMNPLCERLYFKQPAEGGTVKVKTNQAQYTARSHVKVDLDITTSRSEQPYDLSVSVYSTDSIYSSTMNIQNYLVLTSDLKGTVESPEFYFESSPASQAAADNLMLTHGWRRFRWDQVFDQKTEIKNFIPEIHSHIVQASVKRADASPAAGVVGYLSSPGKIIRMYPSRSDSEGILYFEMLNFYGKSKIIVQKNHYEDSSLVITVVSPFSDQYATTVQQPLVLSHRWQDQLIKRSVAMQVEDIYRGSVQVSKKYRVDSTAFYGKPDATYLLDDYTRFPVMEEVLREYVPGVLVRKRKDGFQFLVIDKEPNTTFRVSPLILLDGVPIFDEDEIMEFDPRKVKRLDVVQHRWFQGPVTFFGIVSFSTYSGDLAGFELNANASMIDYEGLQVQRDFYSPTYENKKNRESRLPDQRTQLYWNPTVTTDGGGHAEIEFYTSDVSGEYKIVVEGINPEGHSVTSSTTFIAKESNP